VAAGLGGGHGHIRHEGWVTEQASMRRVAYLEDPEQLDPDKCSRGFGGLRPCGGHHICADRQPCYDPDAFATALTRGAGHPAALSLQAVAASIRQIADSRTNPPEAVEDILTQLERDGLVESTVALRAA
jgi:hypothetical protein